MTAVVIWGAYLVLGALAGTMAGLFGVGGGLIIVPVLVMGFGLQGIDEAVIMHLAVGTSLATIMITGASSAWSHYRRGSLHWPWFLALLPGLILGAIAGVFIAGALSSGLLGTLFGVFVWLMAIRLAVGFTPRVGHRAPGRAVMVLAGVVIGAISSLFGIGGGALTVPWLSRAGASMTRAVGTSATCGLPIALFGTLTFMAIGWGEARLPAIATGFVMWPVVLCIAITSVPFARLGARLAHRLPARVLRLGFATLLAVVGTKFLLS
ncbi:sulfite exporter TauE/SafE family protein [Aidingimonas lacisalsi]|uniref:sulfite exporter TauE/SafE family protein n=1 Tax=Aidingimonas lacisalsi TaxID=2604086 RepID=UPI0011D2887D|nr:sulfite exporter TauE/SafE family protein [Aidingimonas lacisalsi]